MLVAALAGGVAACGGGDDEQTGGPVTLRYGLWDSNQQPVYQQCADAFQKQNPNIKIDIQLNNWNDYWGGLARGFIAETAPDVFTDHLAEVPAVRHERGDRAAQPLRRARRRRRRISTSPAWRTCGRRRRASATGSRRTGTRSPSCPTRRCSKDAGDHEASSSTPRPGTRQDGGTLREDRRAPQRRRERQARRRAGLRPGATSQSTASGWTPAASPTARRPGAASPAAWASSCSNKNPWGTEYHYDDQRFIDTIAWWRHMIEQGYMPPLAEARSLGQAAMFQGGKIALSIDGDWMIPTYSNTEDIEVAYHPQPAGPEGSWSMYNGLADAIWMGTPHKEEAWKWVKFLASPECQNIVGNAAVVFPAIPEATDRAVAAHKKNGVDVSAFTSYLEEKRTFLYPDHRQGAADQPHRAAHDGEDHDRQRGPERAEGHERPGEQPPGVLRDERRSARLAVASHASAVVAAAAAAAAAGGPAIWTGMLAFLGPLLVLRASRRARDPFARPHAVAALRFNLSVALYLGLDRRRRAARPGLRLHRAARAVPDVREHAASPSTGSCSSGSGCTGPRRASCSPTRCPCPGPPSPHSPAKDVPDAQDRLRRRRLHGVHPQPDRRRRALPRARGRDDVLAHGHRPASGSRPRSSSRGGSSRRAGAGATVETTLDRRAALEGADYVVTSFQVGGLRPSTVVDFEIPKRYGLRQTIADTLGVGGIMRGLRTIPVLLDVCRDMEEVCPDALLLQYVNPMAMLCWAVAEASPIRTVGLCHSVQHTAGRAGRRPRRARRGARLRRGGHQPRGLLPAPGARRRGPLPGAAAGDRRRAACRRATASATS